MCVIELCDILHYTMKKNYGLTKDQVKVEVKEELKKPLKQLMTDIIREANSDYENTSTEKMNLDIIKHLIKRLDLHILNIEEKANFTNKLLIFLSIIGAFGALFTVLDFIYK